MSNKLTRDAAAFAKRVQMSGRESVFCIVEGKATDRAFYGRVLDSIAVAQKRGVSIRLSEELSLNGKSAGGKSFVKQLYKHFESKSELKQSNSTGSKHILFFLDRDYESLAGTEIASDHVIYTKAADSEADVLLNGDISRSLSSSYGIDGRLVDLILDEAGPDPFSALADIWREWITIMVLALSGAVAADVAHAGISKINSKSYGPVMLVEAAALQAKVDSLLAANGKSHLVISIRSAVNAIFSSGDPRLLVKGKWIEQYLHHHARVTLAGVAPLATVNKSEVTKCCLETIDFNSAWMSHYSKRVEKALL